MHLCLHPTQGECVDSVLSQLRALAVFYEPVWSSRGDSGCLDGKSVSRRKHFPGAVSPSLSRGCSFPPHSPSSRLVQRPSSCRSLSKAQLDIFYVQDVGFLRTTLIIYLFHFSCVIVPIFYTKVLSLLWNSCCFIVALLPLKFLSSFFEVSSLPLCLPRLTLFFFFFFASLLLQPPTTSSQPSTRRSRLTCAITRGDTTTSLTHSMPCTGKWPPSSSSFWVIISKEASSLNWLQVIRSSWCK